MQEKKLGHVRLRQQPMFGISPKALGVVDVIQWYLAGFCLVSHYRVLTKFECA
jgi:hypothetical protein